MTIHARVLLMTATVPVVAGALLTAAPAGAAADRVRGEGPLVRYAAAVPEGATARVQAVATSSGKTVVTLHVWGLQAATQYGAHAHTRACGAGPADAGPHYQDQLAPAGHAADTAWANPDNEVWLDLTTSGAGNGSAQSVVDWQFRAGAAGSVVIHARQTAAGPDGAAGTAGPRLACLSVGF